ncbi:MAG: aminotransferase class III-fold pyridoxal phosphate-dependent enzyme [Rhodospirillaceae bacterium]|jgi:4-aminobutyrate---pyruvate transaminase|nr:aminotransferase class III-fold pyridoxal phosphate-dependent enzyme [Rhodospirillaceae bacterium]MBT4043131.1 aminotransferase class III-fold pyridoxal phosphate-dependent enzyme [Rhodospirillaceae bacterium]MBT4691372.1 aminotransferase class III-fold pyridoxal phosphate-dependent enzyme [Rhodospirillaceae bacterium]MBT5081428.1 aminotransferase class III-fold pyridoxal phosphate-dependent enzyme [Rhodospirillaceae bacterium]MBT5522912.1 aminotransferase class III-fold pyridoxal phosphate-
MNIMPNSAAARDIAYYIHPQTNLRRHAEVGPVIVSHGDGVYVTDENGNRYMETVAGLWCAALGFSANERIAKVAYDQMRKLGYYHTYRHTANESSIDLAEKLIQLAPVPMSKVLFQCSGSEANDTAVKLAWYYQAAMGRPDKIKIIGRERGYHGSTIASVSVSGKPDMHADFPLPLPMMRHTEYPHYYRQHRDGESEEEFATRMAEALENLILAEGPDTVAAFFAEPVMAAGGAIVPPKTYFAKMQAVLKKYDVLFIADEVVCGFGRTGSWWGSQTFDLQPDMISCAKALSAAYQPISALMVNEKIHQAMLAQSDKLGAFAHGYTHAGHPVTTAVALEVINIYEEMDIVERAQRVGGRMLSGLQALAAHPMVGDVRGVGFLAGMELMADKATRTPFEAGTAGAAADKFGRQNGLILRVIGDRLAFAPPLIITEDEVDHMLAMLSKTLDQAHAELTTA